MGSDTRRNKLKIMLMVSIHAPAWGATILDIDTVKLTAVSIHAPAWGATVTMLTCYNLTKTNCQRAILPKIYNLYNEC